MRITRLASALVIVVALGGCSGGGSSPSPSVSAPDAVAIGVDNSTDLKLSLVVGSVVVETLAPHSADRAIPMSALPPMPWAVTVRTESGRIVVSFIVASTYSPTGATQHEAAAGLSCGQVYLWTGATEPSWPLPASGSPGDCAP